MIRDMEPTQEIRFPDGPQQWEMNRDSLLFFADNGSERITCVLPFIAIMDRYHTDLCYRHDEHQKTTEKIYARHRDEIQSAFRERIARGLVDDNNEVVILSF